MKLPARSALLLLIFVFGSFHGKAAAFDKESTLSKTEQMDKVIATTSCSCQNAINQCVLTVKKYADLRDQEEFCDIVERQAKDSTVTECVNSNGFGCSVLELAKLGQIACDRETEANIFLNAVLNSSGMCQNAVETCILSSPTAQRLVSTAKYCDLVNINENGVTAEQCLTTEGCTSSEFSKLHGVACGACGITATVVSVMLSLIFVGIFIP